MDPDSPRYSRAPPSEEKDRPEQQHIRIDPVLHVNVVEVFERSDSGEDDLSKVNVEEDSCRATTSFYHCRQKLGRTCTTHGRRIKQVASCLSLVLYALYFSYAVYLHHADQALTSLMVVTVILTFVVVSKIFRARFSTRPCQRLISKHPRCIRNFKCLLAILCLLVTGVTLITEVVLVRPANLVSLTGIAGMLAVFFLTSTHPHKVKWRPVVSGLVLQYMFALVILKVPAVYRFFQWCGVMISTILSFAFEGGKFIFGKDFEHQGLVFKVFPLIAFVMCILTVLEHLLVLHAILRVGGRFLAYCVGASPAEALNAAANIFLGPLDSIIVIRPFLEEVTHSELHCLMANGMSTVTGSSIGIYALLGVSPDHLLAASIMSAPAALSMSKLAVPETAARSAIGLDVKFTSKYQSIMDAASSGAITSVTMAGAILANIMAVVSVTAMFNYTLDWLGRLVGFEGLSFQWISSYLFYPLALGLGVEVRDGRRVAELLGVKVFINEIVAYTTLGQYRHNREQFKEYVSFNFTDWSVDDTTDDVILPAWNRTLVRGFLHERSEVISTYALCGFANFICVGVMVGCYLVLIPHRKAAIFKYVFRSMVVGHCASFMTACIAGLLYE